MCLDDDDDDGAESYSVHTEYGVCRNDCNFPEVEVLRQKLLAWATYTPLFLGAAVKDETYGVR